MCYLLNGANEFFSCPGVPGEKELSLKSLNISLPYMYCGFY
jgi:hypothetical protein